MNYLDKSRTTKTTDRKASWGDTTKPFQRRKQLAGVTIATCSMLLAACGSSSPSSSSSTATSTAPSSSKTSIDTTSVSVAFPDAPDMGNLPAVVAIDKMKAEGYHIKTTILSGIPSVVAALSSNNVQMAVVTDTGLLKAIAKGDPFQVFGELYTNEDALVTSSSIATPAQLDGKTIGLASKATLSYSLLAEYEATQHLTNVNIVYVGNSSVRVNALLAGKIDGSVLELDDVAKAIRGAEATKFHVLEYFPSAFPNLMGNVFTADKSFLAKNPSIATAFLAAYKSTINSVYADPTGFVTKYGSLVPGLTTGERATSMKESVASKIWGTAGGALSKTVVQNTIAFNAKYGLLSASEANTLNSTISTWLLPNG